MFEVCYHFNNKEKAYEFANKLHRGNAYAAVDTLANLDFKNYIYSEKDRDNFVDECVVTCTYDTIQTEHGIVRELQYTNVEEGKKMKKDDIIKEDDENLDEFEELEKEIEDEKKEDDKKINWKKILPYVGVWIIGYIIGKKNTRYVPIKRLDFGKISNLTNEELNGINKYIYNLNYTFGENAIVLCKDKKKKFNAELSFYKKE